ncbi:hypothetical protein [Pseudomonas profundi]|uniref:hypothetical protein n=1 Tax=Pseudomonas profundi TaxID=1981513 RepID=UPI00123C595A|nr:hypothetical protein [Pseudomonas profundi]
MINSQREQGQIERRLVSSLTQACETAKAEIVGFSWLTHEAERYAFPGSLQIIWVFDTRENLTRALETGQGKRMYQLSAEALKEADVALDTVEAHVRFDTEEECARVNGGDWQSRLASLRSASR